MLDNSDYDDDYRNDHLSFLFHLLEEKVNASRSCEGGPYVVEVAHKVDAEIVGAGMGLDYEYHMRNGEVPVVVVVVGGNKKDLRMAAVDSPL